MAIKRGKDGKFQANGGRKAPTASNGIPGKPGPKPGARQNPESKRAVAARERKARRLDAVREVILEDIRTNRQRGYSLLSSADISVRLSKRADADEVAAKPASVRAAIAELIKDKRLVRATRRMAGEPGEPAWSQWTRNAIALPDADVKGTKSVLRQESDVAQRHLNYVTSGAGRWRRKRVEAQNTDVAIVARENTPSAIKLDEVETIAEMLSRETRSGRFTAA